MKYSHYRNDPTNSYASDTRNRLTDLGYRVCDVRLERRSSFIDSFYPATGRLSDQAAYREDYQEIQETHVPVGWIIEMSDVQARDLSEVTERAKYYENTIYDARLKIEQLEVQASKRRRLKAFLDAHPDVKRQWDEMTLLIRLASDEDYFG